MQKNTCLTCHGDNLQGGAAAPALQNLTLKPEEIAKIAKREKVPCLKVYLKVQMRN